MDLKKIGRKIALYIVFVISNIAVMPLAFVTPIAVMSVFGYMAAGATIGFCILALSVISKGNVNFYFVFIPMMATATVGVFLMPWSAAAGLFGIGTWGCYYGARWANPQVSPVMPSDDEDEYDW